MNYPLMLPASLRRLGYAWLSAAAIMSCTSSQPSPASVDAKDAKADKCDSVVRVSQEDICLPTILGMTECSTHPAIRARRGFHVTDATRTIGVYLTDNLASHLPNLDSVAFDEFIKLYVVNQMLNHKLDHELILELSETLNSQHIKKNWDEGIGRPLSELFKDISFDKYLVVESYSPSEYVASNIYLSRMINPAFGYDEFIALNLSLCNIKGQLIWSAYYLQYESRSTLEELKKKSDYFNLRLVQDNSILE